MAGVGDKELARTGAWPAGIDNLSRESDLARDENGAVAALRVAENVDLAKGKPQRRAGYALALSGTRTHSLWRRGAWPFALYVDNGVLRGYRGGADSFEIQSGLAPERVLDYALAGSRVFWTNGVARGVVTPDGDAASWGCQSPAGQPMLAASDVGALHAGTYQVAMTYRLASGEESGTPVAAAVDVAEGGGIALTSIPQPTDSAVASVRVYVSATNGQALYAAQDLPVGTTTALVGQGRRGKTLDTMLLAAMPAGRFVAHHAGRLFVLDDSGRLTWSEALRYGLTRPATNYMQFGAGRMLVAVGQGTDGAGLYVADAKRTYFLTGTPDQMRPAIAYPASAVPGTAIPIPGNVFGLEAAVEVAYWMADNGVGVRGLPGGQVLPVREVQAVAPSAGIGASMYRAQAGMHQVVTALAGDGQPRGVAMRDSVTVTVERHDQ